MASYDLVLSKLNNEDFENDNSYINFYSNVCEPLYKNDYEEDYERNKLISLMKFIFEKETYLEIKKVYSINSKDIEALLYGYRYCLNEVKEKKRGNIYSILYNINNLSDFDQKFYPGADDNKEEEPYYELYNKIINHFKEKPNEGSFVCLCDIGFYHSVFSGFPGYSEINMRCPKCGNEIGAKEFYSEQKIEEKNDIKLVKEYEIVQSNGNYYRIFKDNEQIKDLKMNKDNYKKLEKLKYITLEKFKERYIRPLYSKKRKD